MNGYDEAMRQIEENYERQEPHLVLRGLKIEYLPAEIGKLTHLKSLELSENWLKTLSPEIGQLINLERLIISEDQLAELPLEIGNLPRLKQLSLIFGKLLTTLPSSIGHLTQLEHLGVIFSGLKQLPDEICNLSQLNSFSLLVNKLSELPVQLGYLSNLRKLTLRSNQLSELPASINQLTKLEVLDLGNNKFIKFPVPVTQLRKLTHLDLRGNQINRLPAEIGALEQLESLTMDKNLLERLPPEIGQLHSLEYLNLESNQLTELPPELGQLKRLQSLSVASNQLSTSPTLSPELPLKVLELGRNPLIQWAEYGPSTISGGFHVDECTQLTYLPDWLQTVMDLNVRGCRHLTQLPDHLIVTRTIYLGDTTLSSLPEGCRQAQPFWGDIPVDYRIIFQPETITAEEVLNEPNVELRRVMLERMGYERFIEQTQPEILDSDTDAGGVRQLMRIEIPDDEPLVILRVHDPSTERQYLLRVPPNMRTCHQAAAWIAGFDNPDDYRPIMET